MTVILTSLKMDKKSSRYWTFTVWDTEDYMKDHLLKLETNYIIYQVEQGKKEMHKHIQGYCEFKTPKTLKNMSNMIGTKNHYEIAKGTGVQNQTYCSKEEGRILGPIEKGVMENFGQGKRNDIIDMKNDLKEGKSMEYIAENYTGNFLRYSNGIQKLKNLMIKDRKEMPELIVIHGKESGIGKSRMAYEMKDNGTIFVKSDCTLWWDGYDNEDTVIINEFNGQLPIEYMNTLIDWYPHRVQVKGSSVKFTSKRVIITTNLKLEDWNWNKDLLNTFKRRIKKFISFDDYNINN